MCVRAELEVFVLDSLCLSFFTSHKYVHIMSPYKFTAAVSFRSLRCVHSLLLLLLLVYTKPGVDLVGFMLIDLLWIALSPTPISLFSPCPHPQYVTRSGVCPGEVSRSGLAMTLFFARLISSSLSLLLGSRAQAPTAIDSSSVNNATFPKLCIRRFDQRADRIIQPAALPQPSPD